MISKTIAEAARGTAWWRYTKAEEYPEDARNQRCADALTGFADWVESLPDADDRVALLVTAEAEITDVFSTGEEGGRLLSRFAFDHGDYDPAERYEQLLAGLVDAFIREEADRGIDEMEAGTE